MAFSDRSRLKSLLICPACGGPFKWQEPVAHCKQCALPAKDENGAFVFQTPELPANYARPEYLSSNPYHEDCLELIENCREGVVLNYGAGNPAFRFDNVVELEIRHYPGTDLVCASGRLPLASESVDGAISLSVIEHVPDPFLYMSELWRVLKPGGALVIHGAFMQPFHAYPDHYFNVTREGLRRLLQAFSIRELNAGDHQHPWIALRLMLVNYLNGLPEASRQQLREMRVGDLLQLTEVAGQQRLKIKEGGDPAAIAAGLGRFNTEHGGLLGPLLDLNQATIDGLAAGFRAVAVKD